MTTRIRSSAAILLALMLGLTGQAMAVARGSSSVRGEIVICSGNGPLMIAVDKNGQPTSPAHICPDYALSLIAAIETAPNSPARPIGSQSQLKFVAPLFAAPQDAVQASARGPPVL